MVGSVAREGSGTKRPWAWWSVARLPVVWWASEVRNPLAGAKETGEKFQSKNACGNRRQDSRCCPAYFLFPAFHIFNIESFHASDIITSNNIHGFIGSLSSRIRGALPTGLGSAPSLFRGEGEGQRKTIDWLSPVRGVWCAFAPWQG